MYTHIKSHIRISCYTVVEMFVCMALSMTREEFQVNHRMMRISQVEDTHPQFRRLAADEVGTAHQLMCTSSVRYASLVTLCMIYASHRTCKAPDRRRSVVDRATPTAMRLTPGSSEKGPQRVVSSGLPINKSRQQIPSCKYVECLWLLPFTCAYVQSVLPQTNRVKLPWLFHSST